MAKKKSNKSLWVMLALIAVIIAVILLLPGCGSRNARKSAETKTEATTLVGAGETAPGFTVELTDGSRLSLEELTRVQKEIINRFAGKPFVFLPVSRGEKRETVEAFREKTGYTFPMGLDSARTVYDRYATDYIPRNFLIDKQGKVILATVGYDDEEFDALIRTIEKTLEN